MNTICPSCQAINNIPEERLQDAPKCGRCGHSLFDGEIIHATKETFEQLMKDELPIVIDFWAPWCGPCRNFSPVFEEVAEERSRQVRCLKINTEKETELAAHFHIRSIPTIMVFQKGERLNMLNGALPKPHFDQWLNDVLATKK